MLTGLLVNLKKSVIEFPPVMESVCQSCFEQEGGKRCHGCMEKMCEPCLTVRCSDCPYLFCSDCVGKCCRCDLYHCQDCSIGWAACTTKSFRLSQKEKEKIEEDMNSRHILLASIPAEEVVEEYGREPRCRAGSRSAAVKDWVRQRWGVVANPCKGKDGWRLVLGVPPSL